jgi:Kef-type K+ transport system membrane component KefB
MRDLFLKVYNMDACLLTTKSHPLFAIGLLLLCGYLGGRLANRIKFPRVSGYIVAGVLLSSSVTGIVSLEVIAQKLCIITEIALSMIAYAIGGSLIIPKLKRLGKSILWINFTQAFGALIVSFILIVVLTPYIIGSRMPGIHFSSGYLPLSLIISAISVATAPAAILAIVHEYRAKGPLTTTLLGIVALDDATAIIIYAFAGAAASALTGMHGTSFLKIVAEPVLEVIGSLLLGIIFGFILTRMVSWIKTRESLLVVILGTIFLCTGISFELGLSSLITNMTVGFVTANKVKHSHSLFDTLENIEEPIFALFFTVAGAHFDLKVLKLAGLISVVLAFSRILGKLIGTRLGASLSHAPEVVKNYLGISLLPTAGVAIGLAFMAKPFLKDALLYDIMINAVLGSVIINELAAPPLVRYALFKAGEGQKETN